MGNLSKAPLPEKASCNAFDLYRHLAEWVSWREGRAAGFLDCGEFGKYADLSLHNECFRRAIDFCRPWEPRGLIWAAMIIIRHARGLTPRQAWREVSRNARSGKSEIDRLLYLLITEGGAA